MNTLDRKLKVAINPGMIDKHVDGANCELTPAELAAATNKGIAYCPQLSGPRKAANFLASDIASVDVDGTWSLAEALAQPLVSKYATIVYTTVSHTEQQHRFRIVFALPRTITDPKEMSALLRSLALRLGGDPSAVDATRISYGSSGSEPRVFNGQIDGDLLSELIAQSINPPRPDTANNIKTDQVGATARSPLLIKLGQEIKVADGSLQPFSSVQFGAPVHCPYHDDRTPSAFIVRSRSGGKGLYCSTCAVSYWPEADGSDDFDFYDFEETVKALPKAVEVEEPINLGALFPDVKTRKFLSEATRH